MSLLKREVVKWASDTLGLTHKHTVQRNENGGWDIHNFATGSYWPYETAREITELALLHNGRTSFRVAKLTEQARELLALRRKFHEKHMLDKTDADRCDALIESIGVLIGDNNG